MASRPEAQAEVGPGLGSGLRLRSSTATVGADSLASVRTPIRAPIRTPVSLRDYRWQGSDASDKPVRGMQRSSSAAMVAVILRRRGIHAACIVPVPAWAGRFRPGFDLVCGLSPGLTAILQRAPAARHIGRRRITRFTRDLATMLEAGIPLLQTLALLTDRRHAGDGGGNGGGSGSGSGSDSIRTDDRDADPALARLTLALRADIETGTALAAALAAFPRHFDALFCSLVAVGEQTGSLAALLARLADYRERGDALKSRLRTALIYPATIVATALLVTTIVMVWVVPAFRAVFAGFGAELPLPTQMVIALSDWLLRCWPALALGCTLAGTLCFQYWKRCITMQRMVDRLLLKLPLLGPLAGHVCVARWARTLATMFAAGLPLASSLESVGKTAGNSVYLDASRRIGIDLRLGSSLARAIGDTGLFPPLVAQMVAVGEESGTLGRMLGKTADFYDARVDRSVATLSALIEPCIMLVLGGLIGTLVIAMYLPIFQLGAIV